MSNLEDLVPPLELCRKIPFPKFEDSVFVWERKNGWILERTNMDCDKEEDGFYVPAPTLQEILDEFGTEIDAKLYPHFLPPIWQFDVLFPDNTILHQSQIVVSNSGQNPAAFALKFYLRYLKEKERDSKNE